MSRHTGLMDAHLGDHVPHRVLPRPQDLDDAAAHRIRQGFEGDA